MCEEACCTLKTAVKTMNIRKIQSKNFPDEEKVYLELATLLCEIFPRIRDGEDIPENVLPKLEALSKKKYLFYRELVRDVFVVFHKYLGNRTPRDLLDAINALSSSQMKGEIPKISLTQEIEITTTDYMLGKMELERLLDGRIREVEKGFHVLRLSIVFSRALIVFFATRNEEKIHEAWKFLEKLKELSRELSLDLTKDPNVNYHIRIVDALHEIWELMKTASPIPQEKILSLALLLSKRSSPLHKEILLRLKEYLESQGYEVPKELIETLDKFPKPKEINYWEEYQKTLKEFEENGRKFHEKAKKEWEKIKKGEAEDLIGLIQEVIWNLSDGVVYNFALQRFKLVKEAYEIFLKAYEFAKENNLFKTKLSEDIWLGKLKRINIKWGNDIKWPEDYRIISNRIIRLTRIAEFMMWKRKIPEWLYANPYINLGGDYEHNDPPLWAPN